MESILGAQLGDGQPIQTTYGVRNIKQRDMRDYLLSNPTDQEIIESINEVTVSPNGYNNIDENITNSYDAIVQDPLSLRHQQRAMQRTSICWLDNPKQAISVVQVDELTLYKEAMNDVDVDVNSWQLAIQVEIKFIHSNHV